MRDHFETRMHSKSGQGAKTVGQFIAEAAAAEGKYVQAFAEFGAERIGAPMISYARVSDNPIKTHAPITRPNFVMVFDDSLVEYVDVVSGLQEDGSILINSAKSSRHFENMIDTKARIYTLDATRISIDQLGQARPNMPMLGAFAKLTESINNQAVVKNIKGKFIPKLGAKKAADNVKAFKEGYKALEK